MFGFLIGTACLVGLYKVTRGGWGHSGRGGRWGRGRWMLRGLFHRLETTPGQERVISESFDAVQAAAAKFREEAGKVRRDLAGAMRGESLDHEPLKAAFHRHDTLMEELRREVLVSLGKVHEALDERQRRDFAEMIEFGFGGGRFGHGGCGWSARRCGPGDGYGDPRHASQAI